MKCGTCHTTRALIEMAYIKVGQRSLDFLSTILNGV